MLHELCGSRHVPDCEFFINKRDYPHLKVLSRHKKRVRQKKGKRNLLKHGDS